MDRKKLEIGVVLVAVRTIKVVPGRNGVIKALTKESRNYYTVEEVMVLLGVKESKAYDIMRGLRKEMMDSGILFKGYPTGRVPKKYFNSRCGIN